MKSTRRDIFKFAGGSALGLMFTPAPWRLITDGALWSENWPGIPRPERGPITAKFTNCLLCPAGCGVRARCVNVQPVSLAGAVNDPASRGALCPAGLTGHHLPYHPERVKSGPAKEAAAAVAEAIARRAPQEKIAVLDLTPGRTASWTYRRAMAAAEGLYIAPRTAGFSVDLSQAKTVLSLGAPLIDGWGTPGNVLAAREGFRLIQADPVESRTAIVADQWLPIRPGSESALVAGLAHAIRAARPAAEVSAPLRHLLQQFTPAGAAAATGLPEARIASLASELGQNGPSVIVDAAGSPALLALNQMIGAFGRTVAARPEAPVPEEWKKVAPATDLSAVPDGSLRVLFIDESAPGDYIPWRAIEKKLAANPVVVVFGWSAAGYGRYSKYLLPTAVFPEAAGDAPAPVDSVRAAFRPAVPLIPAPESVVAPAEFVAKAAGFAAGDALRERAAAIHKAGRGVLVSYSDGKTTPVKEVKPDDFWNALTAGACWMDDAGKAQPPQFPAELSPEPPAQTADLPLVAAFADVRAVARPSMLMSKVHQESNLLLSPGMVALAPPTAAAAGVADGGAASLQTAFGNCPVRVRVDSGLPPGLAAIAPTPAVLGVCAPGARVKVVQA